MSNILIIKHGSLGDIAQASGAIQDISLNHQDQKIYMLTTNYYFDLFKKNPYLSDIILDKRLSKFNLIYLYLLMRRVKKLNITKVYDLQNSSRTSFYRKYLLNISKWSSTETTLKKGENKKNFDKDSVLKRFEIQLSRSGIQTKHTLKPDLSWSTVNIDKIINKYLNRKFILLFPFCSTKLSHKKWPYYNELIKMIKKENTNLEIVIAPGPDEIEESKQVKAISITEQNKSINLSQLAGLINKSSYVIANDTGPAHMAAHLNAKGLTLFGSHTTAHKVSIERENFKPIQVSDLNKLSANKVFEKFVEKIN